MTQRRAAEEKWTEVLLGLSVHMKSVNWILKIYYETTKKLKFTAEQIRFLQAGTDFQFSFKSWPAGLDFCSD